MKVVAILLVGVGLGMLIWSGVVYLNKPETKQKAVNAKEDVRETAEDVREEVIAAKENVAEHVENKTSPWPLWVGLVVLGTGAVLIAATARRKKVVVVDNESTIDDRQ